MPAIPVPGSGRELILVQTLQEAALGLDRLQGWSGSCPSTVGPSTAPRWSPSSLFCGFCYCYYLCYGPSPITWTTPGMELHSQVTAMCYRPCSRSLQMWVLPPSLLLECRAPFIMPSYLIYQMSSKIKLLMISSGLHLSFWKPGPGHTSMKPSLPIPYYTL